MRFVKNCELEFSGFSEIFVDFFLKLGRIFFFLCPQRVEYLKKELINDLTMKSIIVH